MKGSGRGGQVRGLLKQLRTLLTSTAAALLVLSSTSGEALREAIAMSGKA